MKHIKPMSHKPAQAAELGIGEIVTVIAQILTVIGTALVAKNKPVPLPTGTGS